MSIKDTIFKFSLNIDDHDHNYHGSHNLLVARHPSENDHRMMLRVLLFASHAWRQVKMGQGLCVANEPDLYCDGKNGNKLVWIELGEPKEKFIKKISPRAGQIMIYPYHVFAKKNWWSTIENKVSNINNLHIAYLNPEETAKLSLFVKSKMQLQIIINKQCITICDNENQCEVRPDVWM